MLRILFAIALLLPVLAGPAEVAQSLNGSRAEVAFSFRDGVSLEDQSAIREGVRLAQDYLPVAFGMSVQNKVFVGAVAAPCAPDAFSPDCTPRGVSEGHGIGFNTAHPFWTQLPPLQRVKVAVHEYVHVFEGEFTWGIPSGMPGWLWEGTAELVAYRALAARGLVTNDEALAYNAWVAAYGAASSAGSADEEALWRYSQPYGEAFLRVERLIAGRGLGALRAYFEALGQSQDHQTAFAAAFGLSPEAFEAAYAQWRARLAPSYAVPPAFAPPGQPREAHAAVAIRAVVGPTAWSGQAVVIAETAPSVHCTLAVATDDGSILLTQPATADASGTVFWLWTSLEGITEGAAMAEVMCGEAPVRISLESKASPQ